LRWCGENTSSSASGADFTLLLGLPRFGALTPPPSWFLSSFVDDGGGDVVFVFVLLLTSMFVFQYGNSIAAANFEKLEEL
jgi:hypothetical protein